MLSRMQQIWPDAVANPDARLEADMVHMKAKALYAMLDSL